MVCADFTWSRWEHGVCMSGFEIVRACTNNLLQCFHFSNEFGAAIQCTVSSSLLNIFSLNMSLVVLNIIKIFLFDLIHVYEHNALLFEIFRKYSNKIDVFGLKFISR